MQPHFAIKKITTGYQVTIPNEFRKANCLNVGSMVTIYTEGHKLIIEPFHNKSEALKKLHCLFADAPEEFKYLSEPEVSRIIAKETKLHRKGK